MGQRAESALAGRRNAILDAVASVLLREKRAASEMQAVLEASGASFDDVAAEFEDTDEILLAVGGRITKRIIAHLHASADDPAAVEATLLAFAEELHAAYAGELVGMYRVFMTESSRRKELRARFYDHGPRAIAEDLSAFLAKAKTAGVLDVEDCDAAAGHLMGLLREPLYRELALHSADIGGCELSPKSAVELFWHGYATRRAEANERANG